MDRVELGIKIEQINKLRDRGEYRDAARVCDTIDWRKVKKWSELSVAQDVYEKADRPRDSRNICVYAYNRNLGGKRLLYKLTELSIMINDLDEADDLYREFVETAPRDMERYILLYKLNKARGASNERLIEILEEYKQNELDEQYEYELARLYGEAGRKDDCVRECDDLILWFNEGEYVEKALRLKAKYAELTKAQKAKLGMVEEFRAAGLEYGSVLPPYETEPDLPGETERYESDVLYTSSFENRQEQEIHVPEKDYSIYDTQNVQAELAKSMAVILAGMEHADAPDEPDYAAQKENAEYENEEYENAPGSESAYAQEEYGEAVRDESAYAQEEYGEAVRDESAYAQEEYEEASESGTQAYETVPTVESINSELAFTLEEPEAEDEYEGVDEPTKEIRINTHHWKRYKSYMVEDEDEISEREKGRNSRKKGLPDYLVEKSETTGESVTGPEFIIEDIETIIGVEHGEGNLPKDSGENFSDEYGQSADGLDTETSDEQEFEWAPLTQPNTVSQNTDDADEDDSVMDGQIDIMTWLGADGAASVTAYHIGGENKAEETEEIEEPSMSEEQETAAKAEAWETPEEAVEPEGTEALEESAELEDTAELEESVKPEVSAELEEVAESEETEPGKAEETEEIEEPSMSEEQETAAKAEAWETAEEAVEPEKVQETPATGIDIDKSADDVMDEMARRLMQEVAQDIEQRERERKTPGVSEEEFVDTANPAINSAANSAADSEADAAADEPREAAYGNGAEKYEAEEYEDYGEYEEYDDPEDEGNDYVLKSSERKYLRQYLFINGLEEQVALIINRKKREVSDGTSRKGNIVILGKPKTDKKTFAIDLFKAMHAQDGAQSLKVARITASILNHNGIKSCADKVKGLTLLIENAGQLTKSAVNELCDFMEGDTQSMLVMLTGEDYAVKRIFAENPRFEAMFNYSVEVRHYTVNEFVAMAKDYSKAKGYVITDKALLKLYLMVDSLVGKDNGAELEGVRKIVDNAIVHSRKKPKKSGALVKLREKDFVE